MSATNKPDAMNWRYNSRRIRVASAKLVWALIVAALILLDLRSFAPLAEARELTVRDLSSPDSQQRIDAAETLTRECCEHMGQTLEEIASFKNDIDFVALSSNARRLAYFRSLTDILRSWIERNPKKAIKEFRSNDNHAVTSTLVRAARSADRGVRVGATLVLANVADNSSVCVAIDELRDPELDDNGLINLLQVVRTVASYMYKENWQATSKSLEFVRAQLAERPSRNYKRSMFFVNNIEDRLKGNGRKETPLPTRHSACSEYEYKFQLN